MVNRSILSLRATCLTGITGFSKFYMTIAGRMPRSLASVGLTADEHMSTVFDSENAYILNPGETVVLRRDQIAHVIPRCSKTGLYMASWARFFEPAAEYFARSDAEVDDIANMPPLKPYSDDEED